MSRAYNRHRETVARVRAINIYCNRWGWEWYAERKADPRWHRGRNQWYRVSGRVELMSTPGYWITEMMTRPARAKAKRAERLVEKGVDWNLLYWPDYRKPHIYYY